MKNLDLFGNEIIEDVLLRDRFIEPPFSVLDTKSGSWQSRKRLWLKKGIRSEKGRNAKAYNCHDWIETNREKMGISRSIHGGGNSIFDPALTELMYKWFCPDNGNILDPFAGGSVRGIVAHYLDYYYTGIELRQEQVDANRENAAEILPVNNLPSWHVGDSDKILDNDFMVKYDFIFSCPPYMDLEIYSEDENDLSNMTNDNFISKYESIINKSVKLLKSNSFACFVVGDVRDKKTGFYKDFIGITKQAFFKAGMNLYNDAVLLNSVGSACLRAGKQMNASKKLAKIHQNVLVFKK